MDAAFWGPAYWKVLHCRARTYPDRPTGEDRSEAITFVRCLAFSLPCKICRAHFTKLITTDGPLKLTWNTVNSSDTFFLWTYNIHANVNERLGKTTPAFSKVKNYYAHLHRT